MSREDTLARLLAAGLDTDDPALRAALRDDPSLAVECREVLAFETGLVERAARVAADVGNAHGPAPDAAWVGPEVERLAAEAPAAEGLRFRLLRGRIAAALIAALVLGLVWIGGSRPRQEVPARWSDGTPLREQGPVEYLRPVGTAPSYGEFRWRMGPGSYVAFEVTVLSRDGRVLDRSGRIEEMSWTPASDVGYPNSILWRVTYMDGGGNEREGALQAASRE